MSYILDWLTPAKAGQGELLIFKIYFKFNLEILKLSNTCQDQAMRAFNIQHVFNFDNTFKNIEIETCQDQAKTAWRHSSVIGVSKAGERKLWKLGLRFGEDEDEDGPEEEPEDEDGGEDEYDDGPENSNEAEDEDDPEDEDDDGQKDEEVDEDEH